MLHSDLSWNDQVNYTLKDAWKAHASLARPIPEYAAAFWKP
jgi:hypothetical protein